MPRLIPPHDEVRSAFDNGSILTASKEQLELFLVANGQARILHDANQARASEMGETMRQLLAARQSQEMHTEALHISKVSLVVAVVALVLGILGAGVSIWPLAFPKAIEVYSLQTMPVRVVNTLLPSEPMKDKQRTTQQLPPALPSEKSDLHHSKN